MQVVYLGNDLRSTDEKERTVIGRKRHQYGALNRVGYCCGKYTGIQAHDGPLRNHMTHGSESSLRRMEEG